MNATVEAEAVVNNQAFDLLQAELEAKYAGQWVVIAGSKFWGPPKNLKNSTVLPPMCATVLLCKWSKKVHMT